MTGNNEPANTNETAPTEPKQKQETPTQETPNKETEPDFTPKNDAYEKLLREKKNWQQKALENEERAKQLEIDKKKQAEDYKSLYEAQLEENKNYKSQIEQHNSFIEETSKRGALKQELRKMGIAENYLDKVTKFADLKTMEFDKDAKIVTGADLQAKVIYQDFPDLFTKKPAGVSDSAPVDNTASTWTVEDWQKLSPEERKKPENIQKLMQDQGFATKL